MFKVLHVLGHIPTGGVGSMLLNFHRQVDTNQIQFDYLMSHSAYQSSFIQTAQNLGATCYLLPSLNAKNVFSYLSQACQFFKKHAHEYAIVHIHAPNLAFGMGLLAKMYGVKVRVVHSHSTYYSNTWLKSLRNSLLFAPIRLSNTHFCACSQKAGNFLFKNTPFYLVHNGVDISRFMFNPNLRKQLRVQLGIADRQVIGCVSNFLTAKNHSFLLRVFRQLLEQCPKAVLLCAGEGELLSAMQQFSINLKCDKQVYFLGRRTDVPSLYNAFDCLVMPSLFEGFPVVGVEAQANGLPCLFSDRITPEILLTSQAQQLPLDEGVWVTALKTALQTPRIDTARTLEQAGFSIANEANKLTNLYREFLKR